MPSRVLIPIDDSVTTEHTISAVLADKARLPRDVLLLHVVDVRLIHRLVPDIQKNMVYDAAEKSGRRVLEKLAQPFVEAGFEPTLLLELGTPGEAILKVAREQQADLIIIGRHPGSGGLRDVMFGSVANDVIRATTCPVLLY